MSHESYKQSTQIQSGTEGYQPKVNEVAQNFLDDLEKERSRLAENFPLCALLIDEAFDRVYATGRIPGREFYADVYKQKQMKITQKVFVPVKQYPKFNFVGKILGPKGNSLRRLQEETQCKILIKGRNSMRDKIKEEELRKTDDPRFSHLNKDLYVEVSTVATPAECYARVAYALAEVRKYIIPDKNDEVSHKQLREIMEIDPELAKTGYGGNPVHYFKTVFTKPGGIKGTPKYSSHLGRRSEREEHYEEAEYEYAPLPPAFKRPTSSAHSYEYMRAPSTSIVSKRTVVPSYSENKRFREVPYKSYTQTNPGVY